MYLHLQAKILPRAQGRRQSRVLRPPPEGEGAPRGLFAGGRDRHLADASVFALVDSNKPIPNEQTQIAGQGRPLEALEVRKARGRNRAGLNQRRQERELGASNARPSHRLFEHASQIPAPAARGGADALATGDEVDFFGFHVTCVYTFILTVKALGSGALEKKEACGRPYQGGGALDQEKSAISCQMGCASILFFGKIRELCWRFSRMTRPRLECRERIGSYPLGWPSEASSVARPLPRGDVAKRGWS